MCIFSPVFSCTAQRIIGIVFIQPVEFIQHRKFRIFQRRDAAEKIPEAFKMILHFSSAPHDIAPGRVENSVAGSSCNVHGFQNMDLFSRHLSVPDQEAGRCQSRQSASYNIGILFLHAFRLLRPGKSFIISAAVIDSFPVFLMFSKFCIPVSCSWFSAGSALFFFLLLFPCFRSFRSFYLSYQISCSCACRCCGDNPDCCRFFCHRLYRLSKFRYPLMQILLCFHMFFYGLILRQSNIHFHLQNKGNAQFFIISGIL